MTELYLAHFNIKGARWGFRRFQNPDGSLTPAGRERYLKNGGKNSPRHQASEARKKARAEEEARKFEENRQKALRTGNATEVLKYKNYSTQKELNDALQRINTERLLSDISAKETAKGKSTIDKIVDSADKWRERGEKVGKVWNFIANVHNSFVDEDDAWQKIGEKSVAEAKRERAEKKRKEKEEEEMAKMVADAAVYKDLNYDALKKYSSVYDKKELKKAIDFLKTNKDQKEKSENDEKASKEAADAERAKIISDAVIYKKLGVSSEVLKKNMSGYNVDELKNALSYLEKEQKEEQSKKEAEEKAAKEKSDREAKEAKEKASKEKANKEKADKARAAKEKAEKERAAKEEKRKNDIKISDLIRNGSRSEILANQDIMSPDQLRLALINYSRRERGLQNLV